MNKKYEKSEINIFRLLWKSIILFIVINFGFIIFSDVPYGKITLYNHLFPGRERLPFGENPDKSFSMTMNNIDAMISSHVISQSSKKVDEYRVVIIGDSSIWGFLQPPESTLSGKLEELVNFTCEGKPIEFYNLGYPSLSVLKDLLIIDKITEYDPKLIIWLVTLESFPKSTQLDTPLVKNNPILVNNLIQKYGLEFSEIETKPNDFSIIHQRRNLADLFRFQLYGFMWAVTGIDQDYPEEFTPAQRDFSADESFKDFNKSELSSQDLAFDVILNPVKQLDHIDFIIINEPILISNGKNSHLRYNFYYPRWAYDQYREIINKEMADSGIKYFDLWEIIPESEFTNSAIHLSEIGQKNLAVEISQIIGRHCQ